MDFVTRLLTIIRNSEEVDVILVIVDCYTKISFFIVVNIMINTTELAEVFYREIKCKWGLPKGIVTNRGMTFTSKFWKILY
jgi:hypothetical protein